MVKAIAHRGPDGQGQYVGDGVVLGHARLSILDLEAGRQPVCNEDGSVVVVFNGEIFNHAELSSMLADRGHLLTGHGDAALLPHLYEEFGTGMFSRLNGQFAMAIWDARQRRLVLARDPLGEKPLFYSDDGDGLIFASEAKAILRVRSSPTTLSIPAIARALAFWSTVGHESVFLGVNLLPEGTFMVCEEGKTWTSRYWDLNDEPPEDDDRTMEDATEQFREVFGRAVRLRLAADVPVGYLLSGGLDSSLVTAIGAEASARRPRTFSITFGSAPSLDERRFQVLMAQSVDAEHSSIDFATKDIAPLLQEAVWHAEEPILRPAVFPMLAMARHLRQSGIKVVLTGEGADELFGGYESYRRVRLDEVCAARPGATRYRAWRERLFPPTALGPMPAGFEFMNEPPFRQAYSTHLSKWSVGSRLLSLLSPDVRAALRADEQAAVWRSVANPQDLNRLAPLQRAQRLDRLLLLTNYHLSVQGDRVSMAHGVEARYPFLDPDVLRLAMSLPRRLSMSGLQGKRILRQLAHGIVPTPILKRPKFVYRSPIALGDLLADEQVQWLLSPQVLRDAGVFDPVMTSRYIAMRKVASDRTDEDVSGVLGILTTQYLHRMFVACDSA